MLRIVLKTLIYGGIACAFYVLAVMVVFQDISLEPVPNTFKNKEHKAPVYLISYADGPEIFHQNQNFLVYSGINKGIDHFINYRRCLLDLDFLKEHASILDEKMGAGYWLWKPWIILKTLKHAPPNALVIYTDSGYCICGELDQVFELAKQHDVIMAKSGPNDGPLAAVAKSQILEKNGIDPAKAKHLIQLVSNFIVVKNTPEGVAFIQKWFDLCTNKEFLTGENNGPGHHLHDLALLNITYYNHPNGVKVMDHEDMTKFLTWHHRKTDRQSITLTAYLRKHLTVFERKLLNAPVLKDIRYYIRNGFRTLLESHPHASKGL